MATIKAYTSYNDYNKAHYYRDFNIIDFDDFNKDDYYKIEEVRLDVEQGNDDVYNYEYFRVEDYEENVEYIAISLRHDHDIVFKGYKTNVIIFMNDSGAIDPGNLSIFIDTDGLWFEDADELNDWIDEVIADKILSDVPFCTDDELEDLAEKFRIHLDYRVK